jgi:hypothetical protein
MYSYKVTP